MRAGIALLLALTGIAACADVLGIPDIRLGEDHQATGVDGGACPMGRKPCGDSCVSVLDPETGCADPNRCDPCAFDHGTGVCVNGGACELGQCAHNYADCDGKGDNGCETNLATSAESCGACGIHCATHASATCVDGACIIGACEKGFDDCNQSPSDGCEADLSSDPAHCGDCMTSCATEAECVKGTCVVSSCPAGHGNCNDDAADGCET